MFKKLWNRYKDNRKRKTANRSFFVTVLIFLFLFAVAAFMMLPLIYSVTTALKPLDELYAYPPKFFVVRPTVQNFKTLFKLSSNLWIPFSRYAFNSLFTALTATVMHVVFASMAAFPLAKYKLKINWFFKVIVISLMFNGTVLWLPQYVLMAKTNMLNTYWVYILPFVASSLGLFLMKQFMEQLPDALLESAQLDGAGYFRVLFRIVMPLVKPAWLTLAIFAFQSAWNGANTAYVFDEELKVISSVISQVGSGSIVRQGASMAGSLFIIIPPILVFVFTQSSVIETMAQSGVKE